MDNDDIKRLILTGTLTVIAGVIGILTSWYGFWEEFGEIIMTLGVMSVFLGLLVSGSVLALMIKELLWEEKYVSAVLLFIIMLIIITFMMAIGIVVLACIFI